MKKSRLFTSAAAALALVSVSACVTDPNTGERKVSRTAIGGVGGAGLGYLLGSVIGGKTARILGAGIGGVAGGAIGYQKDKQIRELRESTAGSGIDVTDNGDGILLNLPDVTFAVDSTEISPSFQAALDRVAQSMVQYPDSLIDVYGHTDSTGSDAYNLDLSKRRADAVARYLISRGVSSARIQTQGMGESYPVADNATAEGRAKNRRVEVKITPVSQDDVQRAR
ncbi:outer membrane protein OmpA-like peptidoglycan-associated protein [Novosphingobium chloroacetimidivorans]|uniref:Outer membrane protein OmpA-like peptidoglycan-associated protein n=1 Tax=Novosphingobium chloroacetimidivorans TaxID=1428314 RepID=A0A7W7NVY3_9SPHN|nr:OmpA family protein [Novosphingobium chloroacetimidivorans]MBB4857824.1 outer membrane protein OmpA-like peptidoglycan-associated protein [Novosphingobium chloroacetimidivorans]